MEEKILRFKEFTGYEAREDEIRYFLDKSGGNFERALNYFFSSKEEQERAMKVKRVSRGRMDEEGVSQEIELIGNFGGFLEDEPKRDGPEGAKEGSMDEEGQVGGVEDRSEEIIKSRVTTTDDDGTSRSAFDVLMQGSVTQSKLSSTFKKKIDYYNQPIESTLHINEYTRDYEISGNASRLLSYDELSDGEVEDLSHLIPDKLPEKLRQRKQKKRQSGGLGTIFEEDRTTVKEDVVDLVHGRENKAKEKLFHLDNNLFYFGSIVDLVTLTSKPRAEDVRNVIFDVKRVEFKTIHAKKKKKNTKRRKKDWRENVLGIYEDDVKIGKLVKGSQTSRNLAPLVGNGLVYIQANFDFEDYNSLNKSLMGKEAICTFKIFLTKKIIFEPVLKMFKKGDEVDDRLKQVIDVVDNIRWMISAIGVRIERDTILNFYKNFDLKNMAKILKNNQGDGNMDANDSEFNMMLDEKLGYKSDSSVELDLPDSFKAKLYKHQEDALKWLMRRESVKGFDDGGEKEEEREIHPLWCQLEVDLAAPENTRFLQEGGLVYQDGGRYFIFHEPYTGQMSFIRPDAISGVKGGILADEMGLGKTVMMIGLIHSHRLMSKTMLRANYSLLTRKGEVEKRTGKVFSELTPSSKTGYCLSREHLLSKISATKKGSNNLKDIANTLIVVPLSLMDQWESEIRKFSKPGSLKILSYYSSVAKDISKRSIKEYDVVITTYGKISSEFKIGENKLHSFYWFRIILDEAHIIRNRRALGSRAVYSLRGENKWCLTGTPIQNALDDLYSLLHFIRFEPWANYHWWNLNVNKRLKIPEEKIKILGSFAKILSEVMLRRTKEQHQEALQLPEKKILVEEVHLSIEESQFYENMYNKSKSNFKKLYQNTSLKFSYSHVFVMILKLRQACDHLALAKTSVVGKDSKSTVNTIAKKIQRRLKDRQMEEEDDHYDTSGDDYTDGEHPRRISDMLANIGKREKKKKSIKVGMNDKIIKDIVNEFFSGDLSNVRKCSVCMCPPISEPVITSCSHVFCRGCIQLWLDLKPSCPNCKNTLHRSKDVFSIPQPSRFDPNKIDIKQPSSKIRAIIARVRDSIANKEKVVIFSHFIPMIEILHRTIRESKIGVVTLTGSMNIGKRKKAISDFCLNRTTMVIIVSIKCGNVGLNLTAGNVVFIAEPWWNLALEKQAIDRVHRIGQSKPVRVVRFVCKGTIEERIREIQMEKEEIIGMTIKETREDVKRGNKVNMMRLFQ